MCASIWSTRYDRFVLRHKPCYQIITTLTANDIYNYIKLLIRLIYIKLLIRLLNLHTSHITDTAFWYHWCEAHKRHNIFVMTDYWHMLWDYCSMKQGSDSTRNLVFLYAARLKSNIWPTSVPFMSYQICHNNISRTERSFYQHTSPCLYTAACKLQISDASCGVSFDLYLEWPRGVRWLFLHIIKM